MKQLKILFIVPPNITFDAFTNPGNNTKSWSHSNGKKYGVLITDVPLGVLTLSAVVKKEFAADVRVIDFNTEIHKNWNYPESTDFSPWFIEHYTNLIDDGFIPDIIAFSSLFITGYENVLLLANLSKDKFPNAFRICGGNLATTMYKEIYEDDPNAFNALCYGEGELSLVAMVKSKNYQEYCDSSENWITKSNLKSSGIYKHNFIDDLDNIPYLDYSCINISDYHFNPTIKAYTNIADKTNYLTYMGSRGCPFLCTFCSAHTVHGRKMRSFSIERIKKELTQLKSHYGASTLVIEDDMFLWDNNWAKQILRIAQELELICFFPNALALYALDWEMLTELHRTGVRQLTLAVESGSARVLKELMRKPLKLSITKRVADDCRKLGIYTDCNIIIGMPGETKEDIQDTRKFLRGLSANWFRINVATPLAGSEMYINAKEKGQIVGDIRFAGYKKCVISTDHFLPDEIEKIAYDLNLEINFLYNQDVRLSNYVLAIETFSNVLLMRDDHALAMYMISFCHYRLGNLSESSSYFTKTKNIVEKSEFWKNFFDKHHLIKTKSDPFYELQSIHDDCTKNIDAQHLISD
jgi:anaerobic magnesium-protoporphyrin IX monomethyl ester cyclase